MDKMVSTPPDTLATQTKEVNKTPVKRPASDDSESEQESEIPPKKPKKEETSKFHLCLLSYCKDI